jgi:hypothetical protein
MEPDVHSFVESKLGWIDLPPGAKTTKGHYDYKEAWPKSSLKRLEVCVQRFEAKKRIIAAQEQKADEVREKDESQVDGDGEKTPTTIGDVDEAEDDEAFEKRFRETEKALQERLAKLSLKLEDDEKADKSASTT